MQDAHQLPLQLVAGCYVLLGVQLLASRLGQLSSQAAVKISSACSLAFGPGAALAEVLPSMQQPAGSLAGLNVAEFYGCQLAAVAGTLESVLSPSRQPRAAATFASSTGKPAVLMPWLQGLCRALAAATDVPPGEY